MPRIIILDEKLAVIDDWLNGESRNDIAIKRMMGSEKYIILFRTGVLELGFKKLIN